MKEEIIVENLRKAFESFFLIEKSESLKDIFREIYGNAALYFDPYSSEDISAKIELIANDEKLSRELINRGLNQIKSYSWKKCSEETLDYIKNIL